MRTVAYVVAVLALGLLPATASAQGFAEADALIKRGTERLRDGDHLGAYEDFVRAHAIRKDWRSGANGGHAACTLGRKAESVRLFRDALRLLPPNNRRYAVLKDKFEKRMAECAAKAGALRFVVEPEGAEVVVDGEVIGRAPFAQIAYVKPGRRQVDVRLAGHEPETVTVEAPAGVEKVVTIRLQTLAEKPTEMPHPDEDDSMDGALLGGGIAMIGLGTAAGVAAVVLGVMSGDRLDAAEQFAMTVDAQAPGTAPCGPGSPIVSSQNCADLLDYEQDGIVFRNGAIGFGVAAGVLLTAGIVTLVAGGTDDAPAKVGFVVGPNQVGISLRGAF